MMVYTDTSYRPVSRNRKKLAPKPKKQKAKFIPYSPTSTAYRRETKEYKSVLTQVCDTIKHDNSYKAEISSKYTLAPAYNKGAYQVISQANIEDIGK